MGNITKGFKVTNGDITCRDFKFEVGEKYTHKGKVELCGSGFHFCLKAGNCFNYYEFTPNNRVFEIEASGEVVHGDDKSACSEIVLIRELTWSEVLIVANQGANNTGHSNSGDSNSGNRNSGNWNSGNRNSGYSNSGDRNSGAFCTGSAPFPMFNKPSDWTEEDFQNSAAYGLLCEVDTTQWIPSSLMSDEEKAAHPYHVTTEGYTKHITFKEAFPNKWHNWDEESRAAFTSLPNFDAAIFEEITGVKI